MDVSFCIDKGLYYIRKDTLGTFPLAEPALVAVLALVKVVVLALALVAELALALAVVFVVLEYSNNDNVIPQVSAG